MDCHAAAFHEREAFIHAAQEVWEPAAIQFRRDNLRAGNFSRMPDRINVAKFFRLMGVNGAGYCSFFVVGIPVDPLKSGEFVRLRGIASS